MSEIRKEPTHAVVAFIHTYAKDGQLGSYLQSLVEAFANRGITLHLIVTNSLVSHLGANRLRDDVSEEKLLAYIQKVRPDFVFSTNRGGITKRMMEEIDCPIITWMVDRIPFLHHGGGHDTLFCEKDVVVTSSIKNVSRLESIYPVLKGRVAYLPFATRVEDFATNHEMEQDVPISFVGTYFYCGQLTEMLTRYQKQPDRIRALLELSRRVEEDYDLDVAAHVDELGLQQVCSEFKLDAFRLKGLLANAVSLNDRIKVLDAVADLGLRLYGTDNWVNVNQYSLPLLRQFQFGEFIKTREQLVNLYQRTKIGLNVSHHQAVDGLPYRVFDIMASRALLVTNFRENSDLNFLFGSKLPIPMYRNERECRKLVKHFLAADKERGQLVTECNRLVTQGFSFADRVVQFYSLIGVGLDSREPGEILHLEQQRFMDDRLVRRAAAASIKPGSILLDKTRSVLRRRLTPEQKAWVRARLLTIETMLRKSRRLP